MATTTKSSLLSSLSSPSTITFSQNQKELEKSVAEGLDVILFHLKEPIWPRRISTKTTEGIQVPVYNKPEALAWYKTANFIDCRISAYPYDSSLGKICDRQTIDLVMIDLDQSTFKSCQSLDRALNKTLKKIQEIFGTEFEPSVIWSGNGYHIYIPMEARYVLEDKPEFNKFEEPSTQFLRFAERYLSDGKADPDHYNSVSFGNCMLRIPWSHNLKCVAKNNNVADPSTQVIITKRWNGKIRAPIYLLVGSFLAYLVDQNLKEEEGKQLLQHQKQFSKYGYKDSYNNYSLRTTTIPWIEKLLQTPIADYRKNAISLILAPYLINIKKLSYQESFNIIKNWLNKCNAVERLDSTILTYRLKYDINRAVKMGYKPIKFESLRERNRQLYDIILSSSSS